jgi:hypothetical protein
MNRRTPDETAMPSPAAAHYNAMPLRYPYTGDLYSAEAEHRIRVERAGHEEQWGYFDGDGRWLEGPLRCADPTFCRYMSSGWILAARAANRSVK